MFVQAPLTPLNVSQVDGCLWVVFPSPWVAWAMRVQRALEWKGPSVLALTTGSTWLPIVRRVLMCCCLGNQHDACLHLHPVNKGRPCAQHTC